MLRHSVPLYALIFYFYSRSICVVTNRRYLCECVSGLETHFFFGGIMEFYIVDYGDGRFGVYEKGSGGTAIAFIILAIIADLFASFGLPVITYFVYFKSNPKILIAFAQSIPILITSALIWFININLFLKFVLKIDIFKKISVSLTFINRFIRYMLLLAIFIAMVCNLAPNAPSVESDMYFGGMFAYNFLFAIAELIILLKADKIGKRGFFSLLISFVGACVIGAVVMEIEPLKKVMFEIVVLSALILLEISIVIFRKKHV